MGDQIRIRANLFVENCERCDVTANFDTGVFDPVDTPEVRSLGRGSHRRETEWVFSAKMPTEVTYIRLAATTESESRLFEVRVEVLPA